ncbi:hypothetical protein [Butyrivibrio proteoclasticus]|uniref:hypothetical protein n=1 Tax=Butyrivibrio proteoclasticus TaxID=43305 RepID=UPI001160A41D|nr:hypothetical protein [Butyrivibrio proteoclasticus]
MTGFYSFYPTFSAFKIPCFDELWDKKLKINGFILLILQMRASEHEKSRIKSEIFKELSYKPPKIGV